MYLIEVLVYIFSFKLTVPKFKVFIKIMMFDMNRLDIMHLKNKCWFTQVELTKTFYIGTLFILSLI